MRLEQDDLKAAVAQGPPAKNMSMLILFLTFALIGRIMSAVTL